MLNLLPSLGLPIPQFQVLMLSSSSRQVSVQFPSNTMAIVELLCGELLPSRLNAQSAAMCSPYQNDLLNVRIPLRCFIYRTFWIFRFVIALTQLELHTKETKCFTV